MLSHVNLWVIYKNYYAEDLISLSLMFNLKDIVVSIHLLLHLLIILIKPKFNDYQLQKQLNTKAILPKQLLIKMK